MVNKIIYKCTECDERFLLSKEYEQIEKAPCPFCDTCTIVFHKDMRDTINCDKTASDIYDRIDRFDGR